MIFLAPIAGLIAGAVGIGAVLLLYMLKLRRRPISVSSTLLWKRAVRDMEGNVPWQRVSASMLLLLHLLIVILMSLAIARPVFDDAIGDDQRVYLVIDTSASMSAMVDGRSGLERAKAQAIDRVGVLFDSGRSARVSVLSSGLEPRAVMTDSNQRGRLIGAINSIQATDQPGDIVEAIKLIESLHEASFIDDSEEAEPVGDGLVWVYTDGGSIDTNTLAMRGGSGVSVSPYDENAKLGNVGIIAIGAARDRSDPAMCRVFVRVGRNSDGPIACVIRVIEGDQVIMSRAIAFDDEEESKSETFELRLMLGALLRVEIDVDDVLVVDNHAWVKVPDPQPVRLTVVAPDGVADPLLVDMLEVIARTSVAVVSEDDAIDDVDLVVYDRVSPKALPDGPTLGFGSLLPDQDRSDLLETLGNRSRMISWDRADAMVRDASVGGVSYQRSVLLQTNEGTRVLANDRDGAVIAETIIGTHRHVRVGFALHDSNWAVQVGLPIFLINVIEQLLPGTSGVGEVYTTSEVIRIEGEAVGPMQRAGEIEIRGLRIGVSLLNAAESALAVRTDVVIGSGEIEPSRFAGQSQHELWRWFTLVAIVLIAFEWFVYAGRVKIV